MDFYEGLDADGSPLAHDIARRQEAKSLKLGAATRLARRWQSQNKRQGTYDLLASVYGWVSAPHPELHAQPLSHTYDIAIAIRTLSFYNSLDPSDGPCKGGGPMALTASKLREDVYRILDQILETGVPVEIERRGHLLKIVPVEARKKLDNLTARPEFLRCDPEDIVSLDWSGEWQP